MTVGDIVTRLTRPCQRTATRLSDASSGQEIGNHWRTTFLFAGRVGYRRSLGIARLAESCHLLIFVPSAFRVNVKTYGVNINIQIDLLLFKAVEMPLITLTR